MFEEMVKSLIVVSKVTAFGIGAVFAGTVSFSTGSDVVISSFIVDGGKMIGFAFGFRVRCGSISISFPIMFKWFIPLARKPLSISFAFNVFKLESEFLSSSSSEWGVVVCKSLGALICKTNLKNTCLMPYLYVNALPNYDIFWNTSRLSFVFHDLNTYSN